MTTRSTYFQNHQDEQQQAAPKGTAEPEDRRSSSVVPPGTSYVGKEEHQCKQQQNAARRGQFFQHRPEKLARDIEDVFALGYSRGASGIYVLGVKTITRTSVGLKLIPQLVELHAVGDALPELPGARHDQPNSRSRFILRGGKEPARWLFQFILSIRILEDETSGEEP